MPRSKFMAFLVAACCGFWLISAAAPTAATPGAAEAPDDWLMLVKTRNLDPSREAEFNRWYDEIDIPDVLQVPGYMRARRGARLASHLPSARATDAGEAYVAIYDIRSPDMDKTIIDMLMASWRMDQLGRGTDLIKVVERIYYQRLAPPVEGVSGRQTGYVYLQRFDCCTAGPSRRPARVASHLRTLARRGLFVRATPYQLYRVLMHEPREVPQYLVVFELAATADEEAGRAAGELERALRQGPPAGSLRLGDAALYKIINDAARKGR